MDFSDKNVKSIRAITLPNGRPGVHVVYTDREDNAAEKNLAENKLAENKLAENKLAEKKAAEKSPGTPPQGFRFPSLPWMKFGDEGKTQGDKTSERGAIGPRGLSAIQMKNVKRGIAVGVAITALYLLVSAL